MSKLYITMIVFPFNPYLSFQEILFFTKEPLHRFLSQYCCRASSNVDNKLEKNHGPGITCSSIQGLIRGTSSSLWMFWRSNFSRDRELSSNILLVDIIGTPLVTIEQAGNFFQGFNI